MFKKTFLLLSLGAFIGSVTPVQAQPSYTNKAVGIMLIMGGAYAAIPSIYKLSEKWYNYRWFMKTVYTVGTAVGIGTALCGLALYNTK